MEKGYVKIYEEQQEIDKVTNEDLAYLKNSGQIVGSMAAVASSQVQNLFSKRLQKYTLVRYFY